MTVKKKVNASMNDFIAKGADSRGIIYDFKNILIRVPGSILIEMDHCVKQKPWINRTQWVIEAILDKIKRDVDESQEDFRGRNK